MTSTPTPITAAQFDALLATFDANDDELDIDRLHLILLFACHLGDTISDAARTNFMLSYDLCPIHECDIEICADDDDPECRDLRP